MVLWKYFVLKKKKSILPPLENNWMFSLYILTSSPFSPGALFISRKHLGSFYYLSGLYIAIPMENAVLSTMQIAYPLKKNEIPFK